MFKSIAKACLVLSLVLLASCGPNTISPIPLEPQAASSVMVSFPSSLYLNGETVSFTGSIQVVAQSVNPYLPPSPIRINTNLVSVRGIGETTGGVYLVTGASSHTFSTLLSSYQFTALYPVLLPPNPILPPSPILPSAALAFDVTLSDGGAISGVQVTQQIIEGPF